MRTILATSEIFEGLAPATLDHLTAIARRESFAAGDHPFVLGEEAKSLYVVLSGRAEVCLPVSVRGVIAEVPVESKGPGGALGWSAFVKPYRFRLSSRAAEACELAAFTRDDLRRLFEEDPRAAALVLTRVAEVIGERLLTMQALWAREFQRAVATGIPPAQFAVSDGRRLG